MAESKTNPRGSSFLTEQIITASFREIKKIGGGSTMEIRKTFEIAHQLARALTEDPAYIDYIKVQKAIEELPELKEKIRAFREKQTTINQRSIVGEEIDGEMIQEIRLEYAKLNANKTAADFFRAEAEFVLVFNEVQEIIQKGVRDGFVGE